MFLEALTDKRLQFPAPLSFSFVVLVPLCLCSFLAPFTAEQRTQPHRFHYLNSWVRSAVAYAPAASSRTFYYRSASRGRPGRGKERV